MCGIAGILGNVEPSLKSNTLSRMRHLLSHRGPDGSKIYEDGNVGLVHTRLSIIDLSSSGDQPLYNEDRSVVLICNGEIYNYQALTQSLIKRGHRFSSHSDCEVILHLYEECNGDLSVLLAQLTGMFAFALWDINKQTLFVARDRVGIKPMYYSQQNGTFTFASEIKAIAASGLIDTSIDETSLYEYMLLGSVPGPNTIYKEINALNPGHFIKISDSQLNIYQYWDVPQSSRKFKNEGEILEETEALLSQVIKDHLVADVPVGTFLSAGIDSSLLTAIAAKHHTGIHSFTATFPGESEDEGVTARNTAQKLHIPNHYYELKGDFFKDYAYHFQYIDQPFAISSALSLGRISRLAQKDIKVVLSGDGADELFGGYDRHEPYWIPSFLKNVPQQLRPAVTNTLAKLSGKKSLKQLYTNLRATKGEHYLSRVRVMDPETILSLFTPAVAANIDTERYRRLLDNYFDSWQSNDELNGMLYVDVKTTLVDEMLTKCDRMTMRNAIEGRVPYLDHRLVELAFSIPSSFKRQDGTGKLILRKLLAEKLGNDLAYRKKTGFNSPLQQWLKIDQDTISFAKNNFASCGDISLFDKNAIDELVSGFGEINPNLVFYMVCLNQFFKSESINSYA